MAESKSDKKDDDDAVLEPQARVIPSHKTPLMWFADGLLDHGIISDLNGDSDVEWAKKTLRQWEFMVWGIREPGHYRVLVRNAITAFPLTDFDGFDLYRLEKKSPGGAEHKAEPTYDFGWRVKYIQSGQTAEFKNTDMRQAILRGIDGIRIQYGLPNTDNFELRIFNPRDRLIHKMDDDKAKRLIKHYRVGTLVATKGKDLDTYNIWVHTKKAKTRTKGARRRKDDDSDEEEDDDELSLLYRMKYRPDEMAFHFHYDPDVWDEEVPTPVVTERTIPGMSVQKAIERFAETYEPGSLRVVTTRDLEEIRGIRRRQKERYEYRKREREREKDEKDDMNEDEDE